MTLLIAIAVGCLIFVLGKTLVKYVGWPTNLQNAGRWGLAMLTLAVLIPGLPELWNLWSPRLPPLRPIEFPELIGTLLLIGLGILGYVAWTRGKEEGKGAVASRFGPRRRAVPPPPIVEGFEPVDEADFAPANVNGDEDNFGN